MAVKIEAPEGSLADGGVMSGPGGRFSNGMTGAGIQCSLKSNKPSRPVLSRTRRPSCWARKLAKKDSRTPVAVILLPVLPNIPRGGEEGKFCLAARGAPGEGSRKRDPFLGLKKKKNPGKIQ